MSADEVRDVDAEKIVLGSCLMSSRALDEVSEILSPGDFGLAGHDALFSAIREIADDGVAVEPIAINAELVKRGLSVRTGGGAYLQELVASVPNAVNAAYYARIVAERAVQRRVLLAGQEITRLAGQGGDGEALLETARTLVEGAAGSEVAEVSRIGEIVTRVMEQQANPPVEEGVVRLPYRDLHERVSGLRPGQLVTIAGRPGCGKTTVALDIARHAAIGEGLPVLLCSLEMSSGELGQRVLAAEARISLGALVQHTLTEDDWARVSRVSGRILDAPLVVDDEPVCTVSHIRSRLRAMARTNPARLVIVDYLQLMEPANRREPREQQVSQITRGLKLLAKEFDVPVVLLAQLNRGPEQRSDKRPLPSDLRESGSIEQDSDVVMLLYREEMYDPETPRSGELDVIVGKCRAGAPGTETVAWQGHYCRAVDMARIGGAL